MTPSPSSPTGHRPRYRGLALAALLVVIAPAVATFGALVTTDRHIVTEDETVAEDQYVTSVSSSVEGTIDGNLTVFAGSVTISGTVTGDVNAFSTGTVTVTSTGSIGGSLNGAAAALSMQGDVAGDVFFSAGSVVVEPGARVDRDVIAFGGSTRIEGIIGRDVRGRSIRMAVDGRVRGDVDVATTILTIGPTARISGDVLYRSSTDADVAEGAVISGTVTRLPAQSNFIYGIILTLANVVGFLAFIVVGLLALWLMRGVGSRATGAILTKPIRSLLTGIGAVLVFPLLVVLFAITLVGLPISITLVALGVVAFIVGAVPAVSALGNLVLVRRGGLFGAFLVGAVLWRLGIWLIPYVGGALFLLGLVWGIGGWILGAVAARRGDPTPAPLMPATVVAATETTPEWVPPRAPGAVDRDPHPVDEPDMQDPEDPEDAPPPKAPDPAVQRDVTVADSAISFDESASPDAPAVDEADAGDGDESEPEARDEDEVADTTAPEPATLEEKLAEFRTELESADPAGQDDSDETSRRFRALREELSESGTVQPPAPKPDPFEPGPERDDPDWGLPRR